MVLLLEKLKCSVHSRLVRRYWLKFLVFFSIVAVLILLLNNWEYQFKLKYLQAVVDSNLELVNKMALSTSTDSRMKDTWRVPGVQGGGIFSAYLDSRPEVVVREYPWGQHNSLWALIRIIAIVDVRYEGSEFTCYYKFSSKNIDGDGDLLEAPSAAVRIIAKTENFGKMKYSAAFVLCKLVTKDNGELPSQITFSSSSGKNLEELSNVDFVDIHYNPKSMPSDKSQFMAVCVPSMHHKYDKHTNLVEFIEFYRMMGVNHFTMYNSSVSERVGIILEYYRSLGIVTIIQWELPPFYKYEQTLRYNGIFAALNDCLYRNSFIGGYRYIVNVDLDEFIIPRKHSNYRRLMAHLDPKPESNENAVFLFRNMFFYLMYDDSRKPQRPQNSPRLLLHKKTTRLKEINKAYSRSKYICKGRDVVEMGNHQVWYTKKIPWFFQNGFQHAVVEPYVAALHHYRYCEVNELVCWLRETVVDETAHRFTKELGHRVMAVLPKKFG